MRHQTTQAVYAYWNSVRRDRIAPQRLEIQPERIGDMLPDTFVLERCDSRTFRFRLAGTRVCASFGMELRSLNFLDQWSDGDCAMLENHLASITELGRVGVFTAEAAAGDKHGATFEILILPLVHTGNAIDRLLCSMSPLDKPDWLGEEPITSIRLLAAEAVWPEGRPHAMAEKLARQTPLVPHTRNARIVRQDRRQFRVYNGGLNADGND